MRATQLRPHLALKDEPGHLGPLGPTACPNLHPMVDATYGSDDARHEGHHDIVSALPEATRQCCRLHGFDGPITARTLTIRGQGPTLRGVLMAPANFDAAASPVALFLGGCGGPAAQSVVPIASGYLQEQAAICVMDYRGFGNSGGAPTQEGLYTDGERMLSHVQHVLGVPTRHIVLHGYARGAAVAAELAARCHESHDGPLGGLVLDRPMASVLNPVTCDQETGLGYLAGLLQDGDDDHIAHKLTRIDPATPAVVLSGAKDSLGVDGTHLCGILEAVGCCVAQAHLCCDKDLRGYDVYAGSTACLHDICSGIEA